jgi:hypothetical protein
MSEYEKMVRRAFRQTMFFLAIAIASLLLVPMCAAKLDGHALKTTLLGSGAAMAIAALIAQNRYGHFTALLTPNTFASDDFVAVLLKYRKYHLAGSWVLLLLAVIGVLVGVYGSLVS